MDIFLHTMMIDVMNISNETNIPTSNTLKWVTGEVRILFMKKRGTRRSPYYITSSNESEGILQTDFSAVTTIDIVITRTDEGDFTIAPGLSVRARPRPASLPEGTVSVSPPSGVTMEHHPERSRNRFLPELS